MGNKKVKIQLKSRFKRFIGIKKTFRDVYQYMLHRQLHSKLMAGWYALKVCYWIIRY